MLSVFAVSTHKKIDHNQKGCISIELAVVLFKKIKNIPKILKIFNY